MTTFSDFPIPSAQLSVLGFYKMSPHCLGSDVAVTPKQCGMPVLLYHTYFSPPPPPPAPAVLYCCGENWGQMLGFFLWDYHLFGVLFSQIQAANFKGNTDFHFCLSCSVSCLKLCGLLCILVEIHCLVLDLMLSSNYFKTSLGERGRQNIEIVSVSFVLSHNYFGNFQCIQISFWNFIWLYCLFVVRNIGLSINSSIIGRAKVHILYFINGECNRFFILECLFKKFINCIHL